jgi:hypothetical protein
METLYQKIIETFNLNTQVFTDRGLPVPRTIDIDYGQADDPENFELFLPAVLINFAVVPGEPNSSDVLNLQLSVVQDPGELTASYAADLQPGLQYLRLLRAVRFVMNNLASAETSPLKFKALRPAATQYFKLHVIEYSCLVDPYTDSLHKPSIGEATVDKLSLQASIATSTRPPVPDLDLFD